MLGVTRADDRKWQDLPGARGVKFVLLWGDLGKPGPYTVRFKLEPGTVLPPHHHPNDEFGTVLSGSFQTAVGCKLDRVLQVPVANHTVENFPQRYVTTGWRSILGNHRARCFCRGIRANKLIASADAATAAHNILASPGCGVSASPAT